MKYKIFISIPFLLKNKKKKKEKDSIEQKAITLVHKKYLFNNVAAYRIHTHLIQNDL